MPAEWGVSVPVRRQKSGASAPPATLSPRIQSRNSTAHAPSAGGRGVAGIARRGGAIDRAVDLLGSVPAPGD